jgi:hypothetical protein
MRANVPGWARPLQEEVENGGLERSNQVLWMDRDLLEQPAQHQEQPKDNERNPYKCSNDRKCQHNANDEKHQTEDGCHQPPGRSYDPSNQFPDGPEGPEKPGDFILMLVFFAHCNLRYTLTVSA